MLQINKGTFSYDNKTTILKDISLTVIPGEYLSIIGKSGSGKSTLLKILRGELDLNKGEIFWKKKPF